MGDLIIGGKKLCNLQYTDDTTLLVTTKEELIELLKRVEEISSEVGL